VTAARDDDGLLAATHALYRGERERAAALLPADDELRTDEAALFGRVDRLRALLDEDPARVDAVSPDGFTPLHLAVFGGHEAAVRLLVDRGADLEALSTSPIAQVRPLGTAANFGALAAGRILLEAGADPDGPSASGGTPLDTARANGDEAFAALLREFGARDA
jgi:ankyrin repeat protein